MVKPISAYNEQANFDLINFISDEMLLEAEVNELQQIQLGKIRKLTTNMMGQGIIGVGSYDVTGGIFTLKDEVAVVGGNILDISQLKIAVAVGHTVYLNVKQALITATSAIYKDGNLQSTEMVDNNIKDTRYDDETSQRIQTVFTLTTSVTSDQEDGLFIPIFSIFENEHSEMVASSVRTGGQSVLDRELATIRAELDGLVEEIKQTNAVELDKLQEHFQTYNEHSLNRDEYGVYRVAELRRKNGGSLYQRSTLSNRNSSGNYVTQTVDTFALDGTTKTSSEVFTLTYDTDGQIVSRVGV